MKKDLTELVFILDRSGSMGGLESDTIGGFNAMIEKQKKEAGSAYVSTVLFDHEAEVLHNRVPLEKIAPLTEEEYWVRGATALLDAVGGAVHHIGNVQKYAREEDRPEKTLFVIITDGMENSSRRYGYPAVRSMIERQQKKYGWEFLFFGANIDAAAEAEQFGISADRCTEFLADEKGVSLNYEVLSSAVSSVRKNKKLDADWNTEITMDLKTRSRRPNRRR